MQGEFNYEYLKLAHAAYGGMFYSMLKEYKLKDVPLLPAEIKKKPDAVWAKRGISSYFSFKNEDTGFCAAVFEHIKTKKIVIVFRGTERADFGENMSDAAVWGKDIASDINLITGNLDGQFEDAQRFFECVRLQNPKSKIVLAGHSLGGALAQLTAARAYCSLPDIFRKVKIETYTYNAPGVSHLLKLFGCKEDADYKFIKNYSVINDWCGMYGVHAGRTYLLPPVPSAPAASNTPYDIIYNVLLNTHEGIFNYSENLHGRIVKKPSDFNQTEGLSLWYYDKNNPLRNVRTLQDFFENKLPRINLPQACEIIEGIEASDKVPEQLKDAAKKIINAHENMKDKFLENINYGLLKSLSELLQKALESVSINSLQNALDIIKREKIPADESYVKYMQLLINSCAE